MSLKPCIDVGIQAQTGQTAQGLLLLVCEGLTPQPLTREPHLEARRTLVAAMGTTGALLPHLPLQISGTPQHHRHSNDLGADSPNPDNISSKRIANSARKITHLSF